jgi:two-component system LytT family response regulator
VIIDDEPDAIDALRIMLTDFFGDRADVCGTASSVKEGIDLIRRSNPDLVFLDIQMPDGTGFTVAEAFPEKHFKLVFATAYNQYAIKAIKLKAEDYLLKPVDHTELELLISRTWKKLSENTPEELPYRIKIPVKQSILFIDPADVLYIKGDGRYSEIFLKGSVNYVVSRNIGLYESELEKNNFLRVHKSYLVNLKCISKLLPEDKIVLSDGSLIEISRRKKQELKQLLDRRQGT